MLASKWLYVTNMRFTHPSTTPLRYGNCRFGFPNRWNGSCLQTPRSSLDVDRSGKAVVCKMYGADPKLALRIEVLPVYVDELLPF